MFAPAEGLPELEGHKEPAAREEGNPAASAMKNMLIMGLLTLLLHGGQLAHAMQANPDTSKTHNQTHTFYTGAGYGSNLIYYGTSVSGNQPYYSAELLYAWDGGIWAGVGLFHLPGNQPFFSFVDLSAGYNYVINQVFDAGLSISQYFGGESLDTTLYSNYTFLSAKLGIDWGLAYTALSPGWLLAEANSFYLMVENSRFFRTPELGKNGNYFTINPGVSFMFGSYAWLTQMRRQGGGGGGQGPGPGGTKSFYNTTTELRENFRLLDLQLGVPIAFNTKRLSLEFEPAYFYNFIDDENGKNSGQFYFTAGVFLKIN